MVAEKHLHFGTLLEDNEHTTVNHQVGHLPLGILRRGLQDVDDLNGTIDLHVLRYIDQQAVLRQHSVQGRYGIVAGLGLFCVIFLDEIGMFA